MNVIQGWGGLAAVVLLMAGCETGERVVEPETVSVRAAAAMDQNIAPLRIRLKSGGQCQIALAGNATTGYQWVLQNRNPEIIAATAGAYESAATELCGAPGEFIWNLKALKPGRAKLVFRYVRPWEKFDPAKDVEREYIITVLPEL